MKMFISMVVGLLCAAGASAQVENPDFRLVAKFEVSGSGWAAGESVGGADFRVVSRFMQVYYGGVRRSDEYKFKVSIDFRDADDFVSRFPGSRFNVDYDVYINNEFVGRVDMNAAALGLGELEYDSRRPSPPAVLLPPNFPDPVNVYDVVRAYRAAAALPPIGAPRPAGTPLFSSELIEEYARGDANQDGEVDILDYNILADNYDPQNVNGPHIGPMMGDFDGDNRSDVADYNVLVANWTDSHDIPSAPTTCAADVNNDHVLDSQDFYDFLDAFFDVGVDFNADGAQDSQDLFEFLDAYFGGC